MRNSVLQYINKYAISLKTLIKIRWKAVTRTPSFEEHQIFSFCEYSHHTGKTKPAYSSSLSFHSHTCKYRLKKYVRTLFVRGLIVDGPLNTEKSRLVGNQLKMCNSNFYKCKNKQNIKLSLFLWQHSMPFISTRF